MSLEQQASKTVRSIERYERNWHIIKAVLLALGVVAIIIVQVITFHRLYDNSNKNRQLLRCTVVTLTSDKSPGLFRADLQNCLIITK